MPIFDVVALSMIVAVFSVFGLTLGWASWYCAHNPRSRARRSSGHRPARAPSGANFVAGDE